MPDQATTNSMDCTNSANNDKRVLRIAVGTKNPCKIDAVTKAIKQSIRTAAHRRQSTILTGTGLPINDSDDTSYDIQIEGFAVESGVADQPMGDVRYIDTFVVANPLSSSHSHAVLLPIFTPYSKRQSKERKIEQSMHTMRIKNRIEYSLILVLD